MNIYIDVGNTCVKTQFELNGDLRHESVEHHNDFENSLVAVLKLIKSSKVERVLVSNVAGESAERAIRKIAQEYWQLEPEFAKVTRECFGLKNTYQDLSQMGVDRWVAMVGALDLDKFKSPFLVIDCGTAITVDVVDDNLSFVGGAILPGFDLVAASLLKADGVSKFIPAEEMIDGMVGLGQSTEDCCQLGVMASCLGGILAVIERAEAQVGLINARIITGGGAKLLMPMVEFDYSNEPHLIFKGLKRLFLCD